MCGGGGGRTLTHIVLKDMALAYSPTLLGYVTWTLWFAYDDDWCASFISEYVKVEKSSISFKTAFCQILCRVCRPRSMVLICVLLFFSVLLVSVLRGHSFCFHPRHNGHALRLRRVFYPRFYPLHLFSYLNSWERASMFSFECSDRWLEDCQY